MPIGSKGEATALGLLAYHQGRHKEALSILSKDIPPEGQAALRGKRLAARAFVRMLLKDAAGAKADLEAALQADGQEVCGEAPELIDRSALDTVYFDLCLMHFPREARLWLDRGVARYRQGDVEGALIDFRQALNLKPDCIEAAMSLAVVLQGARKAREASISLSQALDAAGARKKEPIYREAAALVKSLRQ